MARVRSRALSSSIDSRVQVDVGHRRARVFTRWLGIGALALALSAPVSAQVVFEVTFDASAAGLTGTERANLTSHLQEAGRRWLRVIDHVNTATITFQVSVSDVPTANGGSNWTGSVGVIAGRQTWEQGAAYELRTGQDQNGDYHDVTIIVGLNYLRNELWFDPDPANRTAPVPVNQTDALSVMLHEVGHALAYNGWADLTTGVPPATYWSTFDRWFQPGAPSLFTGPAAVASWGTSPDLTTGNNKHWGNPVNASQWALLHGHSHGQAPWLLDGAPVSHLGCGLAIGVDAPPSADPVDHGAERGGPSLIDELMNGVVYYRGTRYDISPLDRATMIDVGLRGDTIFVNGFQP